MMLNIGDRVEFIGGNVPHGSIVPAKGTCGFISNRVGKIGSTYIIVTWENGFNDGGWWDISLRDGPLVKSTKFLRLIEADVMPDTRDWLEAVACGT